MMQTLVIIAAFVACSLAAPIEEPSKLSKPVDLLRPSPINPDIPSDPKPEEKITLIKDVEVKPLTLTKRLAKEEKIPGPYVLSRESLARSKREDKDSLESEEDSSEEDKKKSPPPKTQQQPLTTSSPASLLEKHDTTSKTTPIQAEGKDTPSTAAIPTHLRKPYAPQIHQHNEHLFKPSTESQTSTSSSTSTTVSPSQDHINDKRDIPVPLTRKYHHDDDQTKPKEESTKEPKEEIKQEEEKNEGHKAEPAAVQHPAAIARPIPVAELFAKKPSTE